MSVVRPCQRRENNLVDRVCICKKRRKKPNGVDEGISSIKKNIKESLDVAEI